MEALGVAGFLGRFQIWRLCVIERQTEVYMARGKASILRQEVDGESTKAQHRSNTATTSANPSAPANRGKRRAQTVSYRKEKQQTTQISVISARPSSGDVVEAKTFNVPRGEQE
ncbi:hypothetical protein Syun_017266 [Stephania yunnanensis]|uniref:Uncharacterized protein n=1 Tax=Stephania yunnanensis TaxID=152371 RepID=A0AAP0P373_9MAGN